jgi:hypothetical protein
MGALVQISFAFFAISKKRSFGNAKLLPIPSYLQGGK